MNIPVKMDVKYVPMLFIYYKDATENTASTIIPDTSLKTLTTTSTSTSHTSTSKTSMSSTTVSTKSAGVSPSMDFYYIFVFSVFMDVESIQRYVLLLN